MCIRNKDTEKQGYSTCNIKLSKISFSFNHILQYGNKVTAHFQTEAHGFFLTNTQ